MIKQTVHALAACAVTFVVCAVTYPLLVWALGWALFPRQAEGSLVYGPDKKTVIGSELIAQPFTSEKYFYPRPSAVDYKADAAGGSNLGPKNPDLHAKVKERVEALKATEANPAPVDLISASGSGLDPDISPEAAYYQAARVARARGMTLAQVRVLIDRLTEHSGAIIGAPARVNVLMLNVALDAQKPAPPAPAAASAGASASEPPANPAGELAAVREGVKNLTAQLGTLRDQLDKHGHAIDRSHEASDRTEAAATRISAQLTDMQVRLAQVADAPERVSKLSDQIGGLAERLEATRKSLTETATELRGVKQAFETRPKADAPTPPGATTEHPPANLVSDSDLRPALAAFAQGRFAETADTFLALTRSKPDDARVWYLAAVARGLATGDWSGDTVQLVEKGVEREKAGTPSRVAIEAAANTLTAATGKDWLTHYRNRRSAR